MDITYKTYRADELVKLVESADFLCADVIPVSPHRAMSMSHNPRCEATDAVLACAFDEKKLVGYLGLLSDHFYENNQEQKMGWLSSMWVDPQYRGKKIAQTLINTLYEKWDGMIATTNQSPVAAIVFNRHPHFTRYSNTGVRYYFRFRLSQLLERKHPVFRIARPLLFLADAFLNVLNDARLRSHFYRYDHFSYLTALDDATKTFVEEQNRTSFNRRSKKELDWIMQFPWVIRSPAESSLAGKYEFTYATPDFNCLLIKVADPKQESVIGCIMITLKNGEMKIPFAFAQPGAEKQVSAVLFQHIRQLKPYEVVAYHNPLLKNHAGLFYHQREHARDYFFSTRLFEKFSSASNQGLNDGDADCAFT